MSRLALRADLDRCTGCRACVVACADAHGLPIGESFIRLLQVGPEGQFPDLAMYFLPLACQQCELPGCADVCPQGAISRVEAGLVEVDSALCTGCGDCVEGCPYGAIALDPVMDVARKCELCRQTVPAGVSPVCVAACPARALSVIDLDESGEAVSQDAQCGVRLKAAAGTEPVGRFVLTRQAWRDRC